MATGWYFYDSFGTRRKVKQPYLYDAAGNRRKVIGGYFYDAAGNRRKFFSNVVAGEFTFVSDYITDTNVPDDYGLGCATVNNGIGNSVDTWNTPTPALPVAPWTGGDLYTLGVFSSDLNVVWPSILFVSTDLILRYYRTPTGVDGDKLRLGAVDVNNVTKGWTQRYYGAAAFFSKNVPLTFYDYGWRQYAGKVIDAGDSVSVSFAPAQAALAGSSFSFTCDNVIDSFGYIVLGACAADQAWNNGGGDTTPVSPSAPWSINQQTGNLVFFGWTNTNNNEFGNLYMVLRYRLGRTAGGIVVSPGKAAFGAVDCGTFGFATDDPACIYEFQNNGLTGYATWKWPVTNEETRSRFAYGVGYQCNFVQ
jgi:hypothetical protein